MVERRVTELHTTPHQHLSNSAPSARSGSLLCGSKSIHLTVTYPTHRAWMGAPRQIRRWFQ